MGTQCTRQIDMAGDERRQEREQWRRGDTNGAACDEYPPIKLARKAKHDASAGRRQESERVAQPVRDRESGRGGDGGQQQPFGEHLPDETRASRANRESNRHLLLPSEGPQQQEICDVRAGDEQHGQHDAEREASVGTIAPALLNGVRHSGNSLMPRPRFVSG